MSVEKQGSSVGILDGPPNVPPTAVADGDGGAYVDTGIRLAQLHANESQDPAAAEAAEAPTVPTELVGGRGYTLERVRDIVGPAVVGGWQAGAVVENDPQSNIRMPKHGAHRPRQLGALATRPWNVLPRW